LRDFLRAGKTSRRVRADLNSIVKEAADLVSFEARRKEITLQLELGNELPTVRADPIQIEQVLLNLVRNAIEAIDGTKCARREVVIRTRRSSDNRAEVSVQDTGPGIPEGEGETIFEPFVTTKPDGMGMGLSISRSIIDTHDAELESVPNPEGGSIFRFMLPAAEGGGLQ